MVWYLSISSLCNTCNVDCVGWDRLSILILVQVINGLILSFSFSFHMGISWFHWIDALCPWDDMQGVDYCTYLVHLRTSITGTACRSSAFRVVGTSDFFPGSSSIYHNFISSWDLFRVDLVAIVSDKYDPPPTHTVLSDNWSLCPLQPDPVILLNIYL